MPGLCRHHGDRVRGAWARGRVAAAGEGPRACGLEGGRGPAAGQRPQLPGACLRVGPGSMGSAPVASALGVEVATIT